MLTRALIFVLALLSPMFASAKEGAEHRKDMLDVLGISQDNVAYPVYQRANEVAKTITSMIDEYQKLLEEIKSVAPNFTMGPSRHRIFFHWGFNEDPQHSKVLTERINVSTDDEDKRKQIWNFIKMEQKSRNTKMMEKVATEFFKNSGFKPLPDSSATGKKGERNALASLMYNAHILGDYESSDFSQTSGMVSMNAIIADTIRGLGQRLQEPNRELVRELTQQLNSARRMPETPKKASTILGLMKIYVPKILKDNRRMKRIVYGEF